MLCAHRVVARGVCARADQSIEPLELAKVFDVRSKRISQSSKLERLVEIERRSAWHALD